MAQPTIYIMLDDDAEPAIIDATDAEGNAVDVEFVWPCTYLGPATEDGPDDGCGSDAPERGGYCDHHAILSGQEEGCVWCSTIGADEQHQKACEQAALHHHGHPEGKPNDCPQCDLDEEVDP